MIHNISSIDAAISTHLHLSCSLKQLYPKMVSRAAVTLFHILPKGFNVVPSAGNFHEPMKIGINATRIRLVDLDYGQEILVGNKNFIFVIEKACEKDPSSEILLKFTRCCEQLLYCCFLLVISPLHRRRLLRVFRSSYIDEQAVQLFQSSRKSR